MSFNTRSVLTAAVLRVLKPLIKVLILNKVSHSEFTVLTKRAYVDVVYEHFSIPNKKTTYARVAVLTGLNRKEVVTLSKSGKDDSGMPKGTPNRAIRVVNGWLNDPEFLDENNEAKTLPLHGEQGSFSALVARYSGDITLGAIVNELERVGVVTRLEGQLVKLNNAGYIPQDNELQDNELEKINIMSICVADLLMSAVHNLEQGNHNPRFQRQVVYQEVPQDIVNEFKQYSDQKSLALLRDYSRWLEEHTTQHETELNEPVARVGVGIYYFEKEKVEEKHNETH